MKTIKNENGVYVELPKDKIEFVSKEAEIIYDLSLENDFLEKENQELKKQNQKYKEVFDKLKKLIEEKQEIQSEEAGFYDVFTDYITIDVDELLKILKEVE